uniref:Reverse transcriptase domain-containing protein n=1 Tax=Eutreptiella gymnastica TaxID=73025 RepID=A0A7S4GE39_9EUGL
MPQTGLSLCILVVKVYTVFQKVGWSTVMGRWLRREIVLPLMRTVKWTVKWFGQTLLGEPEGKATPLGTSCISPGTSRSQRWILKEPPEKSLSPTQAGSRKGCTTSSHALNLWSDLLQREKSYVCLLDIAKAFPSTPHPSILEALRIIGTPPQLTQHDLFHLSLFQ